MSTPSDLRVSTRIDSVDALRGFVILAIMLLHNIEHFDFYYLPEALPNWVKAIDSVVWDTLFFLFGGKAYGIFALLFGFTFYLQLKKQSERNQSFAARFLWRLFILFLFGIVNSVFYEGDILAFYAVLGIVLLPVSKMSNTIVLLIAVALLLQPVELIRVLDILNNDNYVAQRNLSDSYFSQTSKYLTSPSFIELAKGNLINGRTAVFYWFWENGRFFQTPALFMLGMLLGRQQRFITTVQNKKFWTLILKASVLLFIPLYFLKENIGVIADTEVLADTLKKVITSWSNMAFMFLLVSFFILMYNIPRIQKLTASLNTVGRMSLTNYIMQSIIGSFIYYEYGLGMYKYTGATFSLLIGIILFVLQFYFCKWWLKTHRQGPLESLWKKATWI